MANSLIRERPTRADKGDVKPFLRALHQLVRSAPGAGAWPSNANELWASIKPAQLAERMGEVNVYVQAILELLVEVATDPGATVRARRDAATAHMRTLIDKGALIPSTDFAEKLGVTRQALSKAIAAHRLFFVEMGGVRYFPEFFLDPTYERRQLEQISKNLGELPGASKLQFFNTKKASLGGQTPLQALAKGKLSMVRTAASGFAER